MNYRAVLFDLDGTLLDTLKDIADSVNEALDNLSFPLHDLDAYKHFVGDGMETLAMRALPKLHRDKVTIGKLVTYTDEEYAKRWTYNTRPYQGVTDLLDALTAKSIMMAVLSNKPHSFAQLMVSKLLGQWRFELVIGARPSVPKKPDKTVALQIAKQLNIRPVEFLYLGDSNVDMRTAIAADMYPIGALWGFRSADELLSNGAKVLIQHPTDLLQLL